MNLGKQQLADDSSQLIRPRTILHSIPPHTSSSRRVGVDSWKWLFDLICDQNRSKTSLVTTVLVACQFICYPLSSVLIPSQDRWYSTLVPSQSMNHCIYLSSTFEWSAHDYCNYGVTTMQDKIASHAHRDWLWPTAIITGVTQFN